MPLFLRKPQPVAQFEIAMEAGLVAVALRRHPRARNYTLRLKSATGEPVLTMPKRGSLTQAQAFLDRHTGWLLAEMRKLPKGQPIVDGALIPLRGVPHRIRHVRPSRGTRRATSSAGEPTIAVAGAREHLRRRVIDFMKREAKRDLERAVLRHASGLGVRAERHPAPRSDQPLGLVRDRWAPVVLLAARSWRRRTCSTISPRMRWPISAR